MKYMELNTEELSLINALLDSITMSAYNPLKNKIKAALGFPVPFKEDMGYENVAKLIMRECQYENGMVDRYSPEKYPEKWVALIRQSAELFFKYNPQFLSEKYIEIIGKGLIEGDEENNQGISSELAGWDELNRVISHYADHYAEEDEPQGDWMKCSEYTFKCKKCGCLIHKDMPKVCLCDRVELKKL